MEEGALAAVLVPMQVSGEQVVNLQRNLEVSTGVLSNLGHQPQILHRNPNLKSCTIYPKLQTLHHIPQTPNPNPKPQIPDLTIFIKPLSPNP